MANRVYVSNVSFSTKPETLRAAFQVVGEVVDVHMVTDRENGRPRGEAFVTMGTVQEANSAIAEMNGAMIDGRKVRVNAAEGRA